MATSTSTSSSFSIEFCRMEVVVNPQWRTAGYAGAARPEGTVACARYVGAVLLHGFDEAMAPCSFFHIAGRSERFTASQVRSMAMREHVRRGMEFYSNLEKNGHMSVDVALAA